MISSFFGKAKPVHYVIIAVLLFTLFFAANWFASSEKQIWDIVLKWTPLFFVSLLSVYVLDFLGHKNALVDKNSYSIFLFILFVAWFPETQIQPLILTSNLMILLASRRLISLKSQRNKKMKLFDATFWITIGALVFFWSSFGFVLVASALILYSISDVKNWVIPLISVMCVLVILMAYNVVLDQELLRYIVEDRSYSFDFTPFNNLKSILSLSLLLTFTLWSLVYYIGLIGAKPKSLRASFIYVLIWLLVALLIVVFVPNKSNSVLLFLFAPISIIITNYLETISKKWYRELILVVFMLVPIINLML
ncbi:MAG: hypothetical protein BM564_02210 [Bacteroidetes bacterium MedPE-SWsnd-G2]|nr:MAG: hypothetical protein BM564_02210 [Bacteroidetes bacterium MedPE-SWsnd-G2]